MGDIGSGRAETVRRAQRSSVLPSAPIAESARAEPGPIHVLRLQAAAGNQATRRFLERVRRIQRFAARLGWVQRYEPGEHAQFGAKEGEADKKYTVNEVDMTYGEIIAMGDLFQDRDAFRKCSKTQLEALLTLVRRERDKGIGSVSEQDWIDAAGDRYLDLASKNEGHFAASSDSGDFHQGDSDNKAQWFTYHKQALDLAMQNKLDDAMVTNAFGDHFLTDAFSAGHLINKADVMHKAEVRLKVNDPLKFGTQVAKGILENPTGARLKEFEANPGATSHWAPMSADSLGHVIARIEYWKHDKFYSAFAKAVHDRLNTDVLPGHRGGVMVQNAKGDTWPLAGDKTLSASPETLRIVREAVAQSRKNVQDAVGQQKVDAAKVAQLVWDFVPHPTPAGQKQVDEAKDTLTNPESPEAIAAWVKISVDNYDTTVSELLKEDMIRFKKNKYVNLEKDQRVVRIDAYGGARLAVVVPGKQVQFKQWVSTEARPTVEAMGNGQPRGIDTVDARNIAGHLPAPVEDMIVKINAYGRWRLAIVSTGERWTFKQWIAVDGEKSAESQAAAQVGGLLQWDESEIAKHLSGHLPAPVEDVIVRMNAYGRWRMAVVTTGEKWSFKEWIPDADEQAAQGRAAAQPGGMPTWDQADIAQHISGHIPAPSPEPVPAP